ncbi:MAG: hypothetical protein KA419_06560 [Acidobacteria bacterium]|nr:hypothetical protein [Acidobacteriota bacterium]
MRKPAEAARLWVLIVTWFFITPLPAQDKPAATPGKAETRTVPLATFTNDDVAPAASAGGAESASDGLTVYRKNSDTGRQLRKLLDACWYGRLDQVKELVEAGVPVNAYLHDPVSFVSPHGGPIMVPVNMTSPPSYTPLMSAVEAGHTRVVAYLVARGADVSARIVESTTTKNGVRVADSLHQPSAFSTAAGRERPEMVRIMLEAGPTPQAVADALCRAAQADALDILRLILASRRDPEAVQHALSCIPGTAHDASKRLLEQAQ